MINKKGQIGTTLTWIVAFGLIFFIMTFFIIITLTVGAGKSLKTVDALTNYGKNEINIEGTQVRASNYNLNQEIYSLMNQKVIYEGIDVRMADLFRYYSYSSDEEAFNILNTKLKNYLDVLYGECYSFCFVNNDINGREKNKQIIGSRCTDFVNSCIYQENLPIGETYKFGNYIENNDLSRFKIKLYTKNGK